ncbi:MAG: hypothetical protein EBV69_00875 [Oxalobacteraceae bacterium]|nr:hypothetical protein [Oxalobacteraceae bacterium]
MRKFQLPFRVGRSFAGNLVKWICKSVVRWSLKVKPVAYLALKRCTERFCNPSARFRCDTRID